MGAVVIDKQRLRGDMSKQSIPITWQPVGLEGNRLAAPIPLFFHPIE
jgi:hypothetical protein